jgi:hypothetical protein
MKSWSSGISAGEALLARVATEKSWLFTSSATAHIRICDECKARSKGRSTRPIRRGRAVRRVSTIRPRESRPGGLPGRPRGISPRAAHRSGREPLDSYGSCHPEKAAAFRQDKEFLRLPVDSISTWVTCSLRSASITPPLRYYEAVRPWPAHPVLSASWCSTCAFSLCITDPVLKLRTKARIRVMPPIHRTPHDQ